MLKLHQSVACGTLFHLLLGIRRFWGKWEISQLPIFSHQFCPESECWRALLNRQIHHKVQDVRVSLVLTIADIVGFACWTLPGICFKKLWDLRDLLNNTHRTQSTEVKCLSLMDNGPRLVQIPAVKLLVVLPGWVSVSSLRTPIILYSLFIYCLFSLGCEFLGGWAVCLIYYFILTLWLGVLSMHICWMNEWISSDTLVSPWICIVQCLCTSSFCKVAGLCSVCFGLQEYGLFVCLCWYFSSGWTWLLFPFFPPSAPPSFHRWLYYPSCNLLFLVTILLGS